MRYPTRYEIVAEKNGERVLVGYTARHSRPGLLAMARQNGQKLIDHFGIDENQLLVFVRKAAGWEADIGDLHIRFSGRTQREAIGSELPFIGSL
jgi:hypothetical protein